ncbi:MAG: bifunctional phosphoribosylaminoimidazolecarboxamide formyltransferase/IMP cyclohydrolase [Calditrichia bacterium]
MIRIKRALISCWDKTGLEKICRVLERHGVEIVSSGGTAAYLKKHQIPVTLVEEVTGSPEILGGRVKTLHPVIHAGLLAGSKESDRQDLEKIGSKPFQLLIVNFYPFVEKAIKENLAIEDAIEYIDIGGPAMLRAAAKNFQHVVALPAPSLYDEFSQMLESGEGKIPLEYSRKNAREIFFYTSWYDGQIQDFLGKTIEQESTIPEYKVLTLQKSTGLRYGENPHQAAAIYHPFLQLPTGMSAIEQLWGKQLSYNNYIDVNAAYALAVEFSQPAVAVIKHTNPCGAAISEESLSGAFEKAMRGDPLSAFGGIVALNRTVDQKTADAMSKIFFECIIAPGFEDAALNILKKKKNLRLLKLSPDRFDDTAIEIKSVSGAFLMQKKDVDVDDENNWRVVTEKQPSPHEMNDLKFMWKICKHVKSNAIVIGKNLEIYGVGAGQMSRVDSVEISVMKAKKAGRDLRGTVLASDAFFPFRDGPDLAAGAGVAAIIQPGGSIRDREVIDAANEQGIAMVFTATRHFKH